MFYVLSQKNAWVSCGVKSWGRGVELWGVGRGVGCGVVGCLILRYHTAHYRLVRSEPHSRVRLTLFVNFTQSTISK
jgi:hypothetical protein